MNRRAFLALLASGAVSIATEHSRNAPPEVILTREPEYLRRGDMVRIAGYYSRNPTTGNPTPFLQWFIVTDDVTTDMNEMPLHPNPEIACGIAGPVSGSLVLD